VLLNIATRAEELYPDVPEFIHNRAYLAFVRNEEVADYVGKLKMLVSDYPDRTNFQLTLALGLLRQGKNEEAFHQMNQIQADWSQESSLSKIMVAAVLAANEQVSFARSFMDSIDTEALRSEELKMIEEYLSL